MVARAICFKLFVHWMRRAASRADCTAGKSRAIKTAMIAITTKSSMRVKPLRIDRIASDVMVIFPSGEMNGYGVSQLREGTVRRELDYTGLASDCEPPGFNRRQTHRSRFDQA